MKFRSQRWLRLFLDLALSLIVALGLTLWMTAGERELNWQRACFSASEDWSAGDAPFWRFLYEFALVPVLLVCVAAVGALLGGFRWEILRRARRVAWFALALLALGPGLIANLWLKDHWGRPRPREITEFGGRWPYESVFGMDFTGEGKSFPCGHATMGFYFLGLCFLLRGVRPAWAWVSLVVALAWGGLIGFTRMIQGGHFATDTIWAAAVMWISAAVLYRVFGLDRQLLDPASGNGSGEKKKIPLGAKIGGSAAVVALIIGFSLGTPYREVRDVDSLEPAAETARFKGSISVLLGEVKVENGDRFHVKGEAWGHGVPTSAIADRWDEEIEPDGTWRFKYLQRNSGYLTEIRQTLQIDLPWHRADSVKFDLGPGETRMRLPKVTEPVRIELLLRETDLTLELENGVTLWLDPEGEGGIEETDAADFPGRVQSPEAAEYRVRLTQREGGHLMIRSAEM